MSPSATATTLMSGVEMEYGTVQNGLGHGGELEGAAKEAHKVLEGLYSLCALCMMFSCKISLRMGRQSVKILLKEFRI